MNQPASPQPPAMGPPAGSLNPAKAMGSALGKSIGFAHATNKNVLCFIGDQGLMINIQDLHYIAHNRLPIKIFVMVPPNS